METSADIEAGLIMVIVAVIGIITGRATIHKIILVIIILGIGTIIIIIEVVDAII